MKKTFYVWVDASHPEINLIRTVSDYDMTLEKIIIEVDEELKETVTQKVLEALINE